MKIPFQIHLLFLFINLSTTTFLLSKESVSTDTVITFHADGRLGDKLIAYCKAKYFSLMYELPLITRNFAYFDKLTLSLYEKKINTDEYPCHITGSILVRSHKDIRNNNNRPKTLFVINLFTPLEAQGVYDHSDFFADEIYHKMIEFPQFENELKTMLRPINPCTLPQWPTDAVSVAVHIRKGSGDDGPLCSLQHYNRSAINEITSPSKPSFCGVDLGFPLKFPPEQFYIDCINQLSEILGDKKLFIYIFTDDKNPQELTTRIQKFCNKPQLSFSCSPNQDWHQTIIDDLYTMSQFDCLIRSCSNFAGIAQIMGNHKIIISPTNYQWKNDCLIITETSMIVRNYQTNTVRRVSLTQPIDQEIKSMFTAVY